MMNDDQQKQRMMSPRIKKIMVLKLARETTQLTNGLTHVRTVAWNLEDNDWLSKANGGMMYGRETSILVLYK